MGARLDSPELDMLLEKRRSHERGREIGVPTCDPPPLVCSGMGSGRRSVAMWKLVRGVKVLFCPTLALAERALPLSPSEVGRAVGGVEKPKGEVRSG